MGLPLFSLLLLPQKAWVPDLSRVTSRLRRRSGPTPVKALSRKIPSSSTGVPGRSRLTKPGPGRCLGIYGTLPSSV